MGWSVYPIAGLKVSTASIVSAFSTSGYTTITIDPAQPYAKADLSGGVTANILKTYFSDTGAGVISSLAVKVNDATSRTIRVKVTVDGSPTPVFDSTSAASSVNVRGLIVCGSGSFSSAGIVPEIPPIYYKSSILIEFASSLTETDKFTIFRTSAKFA
jgi:hypothetical protein